MIVIKTLYVLLHIAIGIYDFSFYRIPNLLLGALLVLYGLSAPFYMGFEDILNALIVFSVMLIIGLALFAAKFIGGGDAKYLAVASLWAGFPGVVQLLFFTTLIGGLLAIVYLVLRDHIARLSDWIWEKIQSAEKSFPVLEYLWVGSGTGPEVGKRENINSRMIPYGIAIAAGAIIMMILQPLAH